MEQKEAYLKDPCRVSSIPYWKAEQFPVPKGVRILHDSEFQAEDCGLFEDEPYFRLKHDLQHLARPCLPPGYSFCSASLRDFAAHISRCYEDIGISEAELQSCTARPVYDPALWIAVKCGASGELAATGIAELDRACGEGILEWIQVSETHRGRGLGRAVVLELLGRMKGKACFATVSGRCGNPCRPEKLYRSCGFAGNDVWHVLRKRS